MLKNNFSLKLGCITELWNIQHVICQHVLKSKENKLNFFFAYYFENAHVNHVCETFVQVQRIVDALAMPMIHINACNNSLNEALRWDCKVALQEGKKYSLKRTLIL